MFNQNLVFIVICSLFTATYSGQMEREAIFKKLCGHDKELQTPADLTVVAISYFRCMSLCLGSANCTAVNYYPDLRCSQFHTAPPPCDDAAIVDAPGVRLVIRKLTDDGAESGLNTVSDLVLGWKL